MFGVRRWLTVSAGGFSPADWVLRIDRSAIQERAGEVRTVGRYEVFHNGIAQPYLGGTSVEICGPGDNSRLGNRRRIEAGTYPLATYEGSKYRTLGYIVGDDPALAPSPALALQRTGKRRGILIHPGQGFISSIGCINLAGPLGHGDHDICHAESRDRVIALIDDLKSFLGSVFPRRNGRPIPGARVVIRGEP